MLPGYGGGMATFPGQRNALIAARQGMFAGGGMYGAGVNRLMQPGAGGTYGPSAVDPHNMNQGGRLDIPPQQPPLTAMLVGASLEALKSLFQLLMMVTRSSHELFSIGIACYYMAQASRGMLQYLRGETTNQLVGEFTGPATASVPGTPVRPKQPSAVSDAGNSQSMFSRRSAILFGLFALGALLLEHMARVIHRRLNPPSAIGIQSRESDAEEDEDETEGAHANVFTSEGEEEEEVDEQGTATSLSNVAPVELPRWEEGASVSSATFQPFPIDAQRNNVVSPSTVALPSGAGSDIYVALHDFDAKDPHQLSFKAGDQFVIEHFDGDQWCVARGTRVSQDIKASERRHLGLVPGNYFQRLASQMPLKL